ncbi:MAG: transposase [Rikenellaceae bacterium]
MGKRLCIDETSISNGEVYTIVSNDEAGCQKGSLIAIVKGIKSEEVSKYLQKINKKLRTEVEHIALDLSPSMAKIARECFPYAEQVIDRFHVQKLVNEAVQEVRIAARWEAKAIEDKSRDECKEKKIKYTPSIFDNDETVFQLFTRSRYALRQRELLKSGFRSFSVLRLHL